MRRVTLPLAAVLAALLLPALAPGAAGTPAATEIGDGDVGRFDWSIQVRSPDGPGAGRRPCLVVETRLQRGLSGYQRSRYRECIGATGRLTVAEPLFAAAAMQADVGGPVGITAVGMLFAPSARKIEATFDDGSTLRYALDALTPAQAREAGARRYRYAAFAVPGPWCADRLVSLDGAGRVLWDSGPGVYECIDK